MSGYGKPAWNSAAILLAAIIGFAVCGAECFAQTKPENERPVDPFATQAQTHIKKSEWDAIIQDCNKVLESQPTSAIALLYRGIALNGKGEYDNAIKDFDKVAEQGGRELAMIWNRSDAFTNRSTSFFKKGEYLKAIDSAYFALLERGDNCDAHIARAVAYLGRQQYDKAIQSCDRAIQTNPKSGEAYSHRGMAYGAKGNIDQLINDQKKAIELNPELAIAYQRRAEAIMLKGEKDGAKAALADLDKAIQLQPDFVEAFSDRAKLYFMAGDGAKAMADLDEAIKLNPKSSKARVQKGRAFLTVKNYDVAIEHFDKAIQLKDDDAEAYCLRGFAFNAKKDIESASKDLTKAISLDPKMEPAYQWRSEVYKKQGKVKESSADLAKLKELRPAPPPAKTAKKPDELPPRFLVKSKAVAPTRRSEAQRSAKAIDSLVDANYAKTNTKPNPKTTDAEFVRRIYLDITGTIPTYQQTLRFLQSTEADKRTQLIDDLLNSDGYASHWFNYWADVLRYTDNLSFDVRGEPYRQWIKQSLAENKPWDKFVHEILTAEGLVWQSPMTGYFQRDSGMPLDNMNNTVRIFLGTRIGCAQCHDHPFDRWTQKEFYQMAAFTFGTVNGTGGYDKRYWDKDPNERLREEYNKIEQEEEDRRQNSYRFDRLMSVNMRILNDVDRKITLPKDYKYKDGKPDEVVAPKTLFGTPAEIKSGETPRKAFARWLTSKDNPRFALTIANRLWKQAFGVGQIEPVDDMMDSTVAENPELMKHLESEMTRLNFDMKEYLRIIYNTAVYQRQACSDEVPMGEPYHFPGPNLRRMTAEQVWDSFLTLAVVDPDEYRELPSQIRTSLISLDLKNVPAEKMLDADNKANQVDGSQWQRQQKYTYKGVLLARASELPSPVPPNHFLRMFGQSDRELISASSTTGSVPQILFMFNGPITHMLLEPKSTIYNNVVRKKTEADRVKVIFLTILNREPDSEETELGKQEIKKNGPAGCGNIIWSLVNTREFLFVQ